MGGNSDLLRRRKDLDGLTSVSLRRKTSAGARLKENSRASSERRKGRWGAAERRDVDIDKIGYWDTLEE